MQRFFTKLLLSVSALIAFTSCDDSDDKPSTFVELKTHSKTPAMIKKLSGFESIEVFPLISTEDDLEASPSFVFGGSADGAGFFKTSDGGFGLVTNHEDNFAVSRVMFDKTLKPISGEYILNSNGAPYRLCSATLATPEEHGFGPVFLTCGEGFGGESKVHVIDPNGPASQASDPSRQKPALGTWSGENALPLPKTAYASKTVIMITDDDTTPTGGQVVMYIANTVGDLDNGNLYVMRRVDQNILETALVESTPVDVEFVQIANQKTLTFAQTNAEAAKLKAIAFGRVEDIDYRKDGVGRELYFNVCGQSIPANQDRTKYGRVYKLVLDANDPLKGKLELILDGDKKTDGKAKEFQNPDNILVTANYAYIQEDPNTYGDEQHDSYIYQYNLATKELKKVFEADHFRGTALQATYKSTDKKGDWEYGALLDVSDAVGINDVFILAIQPHTWRYEEFKGVDGGSGRLNEDQGSQIVVIKGLPR